MSNLTMSPTAGRLAQVRQSLAELHRALLDAERRELELETGRLASAQYLKFLLEDPRFAWLRPVGRMVVTLDERLHLAHKTGTPVPEEDARALSAQVAQLMALRLSLEAGWRYRDWLQRDPGVVLAHAALSAALRPGPTELAA
jgi:hypothetical protein